MKISPMNSHNDLDYKIILEFIARMHEYVIILMNSIIVSHNELIEY